MISAYTDDFCLIPKNTSVIVARVPSKTPISSLLGLDGNDQYDMSSNLAKTNERYVTSYSSWSDLRILIEEILIEGNKPLWTRFSLFHSLAGY
jgi:hypothetical protein